MNRFIFLIATALCVAACSHKEYDLSEGLNKEITLFGDEISLPIGSIGPVTLQYAMGSLGKIEGLGSMVAEYIKQDAEGYLFIADSGDIYRNNIYEIEREMGDVSEARTWDAGSQYASVGGLASMLSFINLKCCNQRITISAANPLSVGIPASCGATISYTGAAGGVTMPVAELDNVTLKRRSEEELFSMTLPADVTEPVSSIQFSHLALDMPATPTSRISDRTGNLFLAFTYSFKSGITVGEGFSFPLKNISTGQVNLPLGKYRLKKCEVEIELENTIPLSVTIDNIRVLEPRESKDEEAVVNENITVSSGITVAGGSMEKPSTTVIKVAIEALSGVIPDIPELLLDLQLNAQPNLGIVPLSVKEGLYVKSSSARLCGGITLGNNENE